MRTLMEVAGVFGIWSLGALMAVFAIANNFEVTRREP